MSWTQYSSVFILGAANAIAEEPPFNKYQLSDQEDALTRRCKKS